jgi:inhibitor of cysteine peptidase
MGGMVNLLQIVFIAFLTMFILGGCSPFGRVPVKINESDDGKTIEVASGEDVDIELNGNPTTGYQWQLEGESSPVIRQISEPEFKPATAAIGSGGKVLIKFKATNIGKAGVKLVYKRSWEKTSPSKTFKINFNVK